MTLLRRWGAERGAAAVEFAILLPLFLVVLGGITDWGRYFFTQVQLANAAREGARAAVVSTMTQAQIEQRAKASAPTLTTMTAKVNAVCPGSDSSVTTSVTFNWILLEPALGLFGGSNFLDKDPSSTAVMKCGG